ncbi:jerky protein homolog-like [Anoplophora glabripennis]|uniref:jerky protein homolog-like n=1 Tax=Anoplophora glabripennis TaxID=217634 RepID=UPI000873AB98|nr:jerky protein homolog-like [Anoplophora glabripennis]
MSTPKRKRVVISLQKKLEALERIRKGESLKKLASELGVGENTVGDWKRNRNKLEQWKEKTSSTGTSSLIERKSMKSSDYEKLGDALFLWFTQQRDKGAPFSGPILQAKALSLRTLFPEETKQFTASQSWLDRWKKRHDILQPNICGEKLSADNSAPAKTLASQQETSAPGYKRSKERVTILACSNASGSHKLPLMMIGKSAKPRAFKNLSPTAMPVYYRNQRSAWMDSKLFKAWFYEEFVTQVEQHLKKMKLSRKALLLLDNAPSHPSEDELCSEDIKVLFFPPNVTSLIQPMDQGVLENLKRNYRFCLLKSFLEALENGEDLTTHLKKVNLKDVMFWLAQSWHEMKPETLMKSWRKTVDFSKDNLSVEAPVLPLLEMARSLPSEDPLTENDVEEWIRGDDVELDYTDEEIASIVQERQRIEESSSDEEIIFQKLSHSEDLAAFETALAHVEQQNEATPADIFLMKKWRHCSLDVTEYGWLLEESSLSFEWFDGEELPETIGDILLNDEDEALNDEEANDDQKPVNLLVTTT